MRSSSSEPCIARAAAGSYGAAGLFAGFFLLLAVVAVYENRGSWPVLAVAGGVTVWMFVKLAYLRLVIGPDGIRYRTLGGQRVLAFADIKRAYLETSVNRFAPHGVVSFWIQPHEGKRLNISLRAFSPQAAAALLAALEQHDVPLDVPNSVAGQRLAREIRGVAGPRPRRVR